MTKRERITLLCEYLVDVREGLPEKEPARGDELLALMCKAWNSESYQELERLLPRLKASERQAYWHLSERYLRYGEVRVAFCKRCGSHHASAIGKVHRHPPGRAITLRPRVLRVTHPRVSDLHVGRALDWLDECWRGPADLPKAVEMVESERRLRVA